MDDKILTLCEDVAALKSGQQSMEDKIDRLTYYLQGNGRPGVVTELREADDKLSDRMDGVDVRISRWTGIGIGAWGLTTLLLAVHDIVHVLH